MLPLFFHSLPSQIALRNLPTLTFNFDLFTTSNIRKNKKIEEKRGKIFIFRKRHEIHFNDF